MDFIKGLEKALELGLTKEEFMFHWQAESLELKNGNGRAVSELGSQACQNHVSGGERGRVDHSSQEWQQVRDELKQELYLQLNILMSQQTEKQEQLWQQMQKSMSQLMEEVRHQFGILCQHVSNTADSQGSSLKHNFMQEFDLLKQDFKKDIEQQYMKYADEPASFGVSLEKSRMAYHQNSHAEQNICRFGDLTVNNEELSTQESTIEFHHYYEESQQDQLEDNDDSFCDSLYDWHMEEATLLVDRLERVSANGDKATHDIQSMHSKSCEKGTRKSTNVEKSCMDHSYTSKPCVNNQENRSLSPAISLSPAVSLLTISEEEESTEATGFYADAISNQMKQTSSPESSVSASIKSTMYSSKVVSPSRTESDYHWNKFTISDSKNFSASHQIYLSPFINAKTWKARIHITFNEEQQLKVSVRISRGDYNSNDMWPLKFTGYGYIFHPYSKRFTPVWELPLVTCQKPSSTDIIDFPTEVCLSTNRGSYPEVTFRELELRRYIENNILFFKWNLKANKLLPATKSKSRAQYH